MLTVTMVMFDHKHYNAIYNKSNPVGQERDKTVKATLQGKAILHEISDRTQALMSEGYKANLVNFKGEVQFQVSIPEPFLMTVPYEQIVKFHEGSSYSDNSRGRQVVIGFSCATTQKTPKDGVYVWKHGIPHPYLLKETRNPKTQYLRENCLEPLLRNMWKVYNESFPEHARRSCEMTPEQFRYPEGTGFAQVTVALNNSTRWHYDAGNTPGTLTVIYIMTDGNPIVGGQQVLKDGFGDDVVVIESCNGLLIIGDYTRHLHGVLDVLSGSRSVVIAYCKTDISTFTDRYVPPGMVEREALEAEKLKDPAHVLKLEQDKAKKEETKRLKAQEKEAKKRRQAQEKEAKKQRQAQEKEAKKQQQAQEREVTRQLKAQEKQPKRLMKTMNALDIRLNESQESLLKQRKLM